MKSTLLVIVGAILGAAISLMLAGGTLTGMGAGAGIVTGLKAGVCVTAEAARSKGFVTGAQVDELIKAASQQLAGGQPATDTTLSGGGAECQKLLADLKQGHQKSK